MNYKTVAGFGVAEVIEKKSRFISSVIPVVSEQEAVDFISKIKTKHWDASHNVYAYFLGKNNIQRYSDDGEPSGTAGIPVLEVIKKEGLQDVVVVVTRYFGGTLLGTGGLVRAYGKSAKEGIVSAGIIKRKFMDILEVTVDYRLLGKVQNEAISGGNKIECIDYKEKVVLKILTVIDDTNNFIDKLIDITNGKVLIENKGQKYLDE